VSAGVSQSTISRIELGRGSSITLATWERIAAAVGLDLSAMLHTAFQGSAFTAQLRCHRLLVDRAALGGWAGWTIVDLHDPAVTTTILQRTERNETAVVHAWDVVTNIPAAIRRLWERIELERHERGPGHIVGGAVVIVSSGDNRRRLTESAAAVVAGLDLFSIDWWAALGGVRVPMPTEIGTLWTDPTLTGLRPRIPYVDARPRHEDPIA
jgi:transcriptional regulator with XRE-family HTH domain